ncbi:MAG: VCBS repeat-containing protein [Saprospiraceae bacterium]|nr:VCBS repeat-containing protein [Saprospiraceae bacterium]MCF8249312.1 VCBS repeat-containing protein [Saprospiraceae bacterium]MCF8279733.1 VCBS repeat-containing protein [Bacteroidales bacterium]MCF8311411.1 VCBS repeat-containing protein [Saprospiraceae bacterium]MCF8439931.1 VCBS repeat-containing protein [Saprospiraceae bacterium]
MKKLFSACVVAAFLLISCNSDKEKSSVAAPAADVHFELVNPAASGINFINNIKETFEENIITNSYLYNGGGVAIIDVNNDGLPDIYFSATQEANRLYLNKGNFQFEDITEKAGVAAIGGIKTGVSVVDINGDGFQDIYVCRSGMQPTDLRTNLLFINNGDNTFTQKANEYGLDDRSASNHANFFDFDNDGDLDVYVLNHPVAWSEVNRIRAKQETQGGPITRITTPLDEWESDKLFRNDGNGHFANVSVQMGINNRAWGLSATVSDFNSDGYLDIYVGNDYVEPDLLYINQKGKGFKDEVWSYFRHTSNHTMGVDIADVNNDGLIDLAALDMTADDNQRQKELMTTMKQERYHSLLQYGYGNQHMRNMLQLNTGAAPGNGATFSDIGQLAGVWATDWSWSPLLADFDNDGMKDLYVTNGYRRDVTNLDYLTYTVDSVMKIGGLNNVNFKTIDEYLKKIPSKPLRNYMFKNKDGLQFQNVSEAWGLIETSYSNGSAYADLDNDGDLDLVVNQVDGTALVYRNQKAGKKDGNWLQISLKGNAGNPTGVGTKLRIRIGKNIQYQEMTPTRGFFSSSQPLFHFGLGGSDIVDKLEVKWPNGKVQMLEKITANQRLELKMADAKTVEWESLKTPAPNFQVATGMGIEFRHIDDDFNDFNREWLIPHAFSNLGPNIAQGDVNADGLQDFFIGGGRNQSGALFIQQKNCSFKIQGNPAFDTDKTYEDMGCAFFDADGDSDADLYVVSGGSTYDAGSSNYQDRLYLNDGNGNFEKAPNGTLPAITSSGSCVTPFDFDQDGDLDLMVGGMVTPGRYPESPQTFMLQNNGGRFTDVCPQNAPFLSKIGMVNDLIWADLDGDKSAELIVVGEWLPVSIFKNTKGKLEDVTEKFGLKESNGWWNCVHAADIDNDGDIDLVAGNLGLNSRLKASVAEPIQLFADDFDRNGSLDPVMAWYYDGKQYPLPQRDVMIKQMPGLKKDFVYHRAYGLATMETIFKRAALDAAKKYSAKTFSTMFFENKGGKFIAHELPIATQLSTCNQILSADFNGDGNLDLLMVGNNSHSEVESGPYDASNGTVLLGDGKGSFAELPNRISGFWATKEARDMVLIRLANGKTLYLVANNNDYLQGYLGK